MLTEMNLQVA